MKLLVFYGIIQVKIYAWAIVIIPINVTSIKLCLTVNLNKSDSFPTIPVDAQAIAIDYGEIILPHTPPVVFAATNNVSLRPNCWAVCCCNPQKSAFDEVSEPVKNTPNHPRNGEKKGNINPVFARTSAIVEDIPE